MLDEYFVDNCKKLIKVINEYGDYEYTESDTIACRFRYISRVNRTSGNEINETDAMLWVSPETQIERGSLILYNNVVYKIETITRALRLGETSVQFLKCELLEISIGIS
jgi:hypothetical protein